ncbi:MAG: hypothetical protein GXX83_05930 [Gaiellales bacterium]|nr:hypothetical protein [Gaiellales bacterium]
MADKKVERNVRSSEEERPGTPAEKLQGSISDKNTLNMAQSARDRAKTALLDRFRDREERFRRDQAARAREEEPSIPHRAPAPPAGDEGGGLASD